MDCNDRIKHVRETLGLSQSEFASQLAMEQSGVSKVELGKRIVSNSLIVKVCAVFGIDEHWLRTGEGDMYPAPADEDAELMELMAMLTADDMDPNKKRIVANMCRYIMSLSSDDLDRLNDLISALSSALDVKKDED